MGLERLSILFELEQRLEITLPNEAISSRTVGDLESFVRAATPSERACPGATIFYRIRRGFVAAGVPRNKVRPSAPLASLVPTGPVLRRTWNAIEVHQRGLPRLKPHRTIDGALCFLCGIVGLVALSGTGVLIATAGARLDASLAAGFLVLGIVIFLFMRASSALGWSHPDGIETVRDLVRYVAPASTLDLVCLVIAEECSLDPSVITRDSDLARDLGI